MATCIGSINSIKRCNHRMTRQRTLRLLFLGLVSLFSLLIEPTVWAQTPPGAIFRAPWMGYDTATYPQGLWPRASDVADFNRDGVPDLAAVSWGGTPYLSILLGDGNGGFRPPVLYPLDLESMDLVARDFDNDGDVDLAVAETGRLWEGLYVSLWRNGGEGNFTRVGLFVTGDDGPSGITAADFNGDGFADVAVAHDEYIGVDNTVSVLFNNSGSGFQSPVVYTIASGTNDLDSADMDGDGDADIIVAHEGNRWSTMRNDNGTFAPLGTFQGIPAGSIPEEPTITAADVDGDGDRDVLYSNRDSGGVGQGAIGLWRNNGNFTFGAPETLSLLTPLDTYTSGGTDIDVADVTHDGAADILVGNADGLWFLLAGNGSGGFLQAKLFAAGDAHDYSSSIDIEAVDLDGEGDLDVIVLANGSLEACVYLNPGSGQFEQPLPTPMANPGYAPAFPTNLRAGDIDRDGDLDLVTGFRSDFSDRYGLTLRRNNGDGTFGPLVEMLEPTYPIDLVLADINRDGSLDILCLLNDGQLVLRPNNGSGVFNTRIVTIGFGNEHDHHQLAVADVDNDGDLDAVVPAVFGVKIAKNLGNNQFGAPSYHEVGNFLDTIGFGDFNRDGNVDLLTNSGVQGYPEVSNGNGNGTFGPPFTVPTGRDVMAFATADFDRDGNLDFASFYNLDEQGLGIRRGRGQGSFFPLFKMPGAYYFGDHVGTLDVADVDGDGNLDVLKGSFGAQDFVVWRGRGDGTFHQDVRYGVGWNVFDIEVGDFDGDGVLDVAAICQVDNGVWWYPGVVIIKGIATATTVLPSSFTVTRGERTSGGLPDLFFSDNAYLNVEARRATEIAAASVEIVVEGTAPTEAPSALTFVLEAAQSGDPTRQRIELYNFQTSQWEIVDERPSPFADTTIRVNITTNAARFVQPGTRTMRARIGYHDRGVTFISWGARYDLTAWEIR